MSSEKKKIAVVVPKYGLVGGGERFVFELTERLAENGKYDIHVFANKWQGCSPLITFHKVPIITFPKWLTTISFAYFANKKIASMDFDLVHTHDRIFRADIATVHSIPHSIWVKEIRQKKMMSLFDLATCWVEKKLFASRDLKVIMPVSNLAKEKMLEEYEVNPEKIHIVHPGVDLEKFRAVEPATRQAIRQEFGVEDDDLLVLFVSMNFELKGLDLLLAAMSQIQNADHRKRIKVLVAGKGNIRKYQAITQNLGIESNTFFAGVRHDMERVYQSGDLFVLLSGFDTFGMVVTEAMASGLPVIVSDQVGAKDLVRNGENGFVVSREDIDGISSIFVNMTDRHTYKVMSENARKSMSVCGWDDIVKEVMKIYDSF